MGVLFVSFQVIMPRSKGWKKAMARRDALARGNQETKSPVILQAPASPVIAQAPASPVIAQAKQISHLTQNNPNCHLTRNNTNCHLTGNTNCHQTENNTVIAQATEQISHLTRNNTNCHLSGNKTNCHLTKNNTNCHLTDNNTNCHHFANKNAKAPFSSCSKHLDGTDKDLLLKCFPNLKEQSNIEKECILDTNVDSGTTSEYIYTATPICEHLHDNVLQPQPSKYINFSELHSFYLESKMQFNCKEIVFGSFHQGDQRFSEETRGSQCVMNALMALMKEGNINSTTDLDKVLYNGDMLYNRIMSEMKANGTFQSRLMSFDELPTAVFCENGKTYLCKSNVISGLALEHFGQPLLPTLHQSLTTAFKETPQVLVMIGAICSAVYIHEERYHFFDSHSHGQDGLSSPDGMSLLISFDHFDDLISYMYALYEDMGIDLTSSQFEILPLRFTSYEPQNQSKIEVAKDTEWNIVSYRKGSKPKRNARQNVVDNKVESYFGNTTLIGKYFKDQKQKACHLKEQNKELNRKTYQMLYKRRQRESELYKSQENEARKQSRKQSDKKEKEQQRTLYAKRKARLSEGQKQKDRQSTLKSMRKARQNEDQRQKDRQSTLKSMTKARQNEEQKQKDRQSTLKSMRKARESEEQKQKDRISSFQSKTSARTVASYKEKEKKHKFELRQLECVRQREIVSEKQSKRRARLIKEFREWEADQQRNKRKTQEAHMKTIDRQSKQKRRQHAIVLEGERLRKQQLRSKDNHRPEEKLADKIRKSNKRKNDSFTEVEHTQAKMRKYGSDIDTCIKLFHQSISCGPLYICSCCHQTWFKQSVTSIKSLSHSEQQKFLTNTISFDNSEWICYTCKSAVVSGKVPKLSVINGMSWPEKPKELYLYPLEERLIALRIPFMQIRELPRGRQLSVKGNVVNVPVDIQPVINALPRPLDENVTVAVKLKKKMSFKSCVFSENVRPLHVLVALHWLMQSSDLYKNANVDIDQEWVNQVTTESSEIMKEFLEAGKGKTNQHSNKEHKNSDSISSNFVQADELYDSDAEEVNNENVGNIDTLLDDANAENRTTFTFAPGEGQQPLSIYQDRDSEYLCFPCLFCGQRRKENSERIVPVYYSDIAKWELRSKDRRAANSVPNIFFKLKKIQMKQLNDKVNLAVRRCQTDPNKTMTAAEARDSICVENMVKKDEGYYIFKQLRNSPAYLETRKKDVFAMIRQLGLPTWFMSLSSADTRWLDLLNMLANLNEEVNYTKEDIDKLTWEQKIKLIQKDPVTCSRYFDHRVRQFLNTFLKSEHKPLGNVTDYFYRVEFQQRGSPHIHMVVWIEDAPKLNFNTTEEITAYVDRYLQCSKNDENIQDLIELQIHKHSRTCRKKQNKICRFGYPLPPLKKTIVLDPLECDKDVYDKKYKLLQKCMNEEKNGYDMTYEQFLKSVVKLSEEEYIKCIRSSLTTSKVFMKRNPDEIRINLYNKHVLKAWKANIDIQFILDPYACAMYIVSYISKSQRGMSNLLHAAAKEARNGNLDIKRQVRHIGNIFSNSVEVSAQEAVYLILQMPLTQSSRDVVFVNTSTPEKRIQLLKSKEALDELPENSTDIMSDNVIKRYAKRPISLSNWCLADYVAQLDITYPEKVTPSDEDNDAEGKTDDELSLHDKCNIDNEFDENFNVITLKNGITIRRRKKNKVIRYVRFNKKTDEENYYRERILLFLPWRNENVDLLGNCSSFKEHYQSVQHIIDHKCNEYEHHVEELELARELAENEYDAYDDIAPSAQQAEAEDAEEEPIESEAFIYFNPDRVSEHREYDIQHELGGLVSAPQLTANEHILPDNEYRSLIRSLNTNQKQFHDHVVHWIKTKDTPIYTFLSGGAGVGKSVVIRALYQTLYKYLNLREGEDCDDIRILKCAYTGKAAFNIGGSTISSAFKQKYKQSDQSLTCDSLNTFRSKYRNLSVVIIDEISMVSNTMLNFIDQRLQELKGTRIPFGGISIIAVGDLYQLKPVSGGWIFNDMKHDATSLSRNLWKEYFKSFELTEIMRQKDDIAFAHLLNRLRLNALTPEDICTLKQCEVTPECEHYHLSAPHLFAENYFMHLFNDFVINNMNTEKVIIECHDSVVSPKLTQEKQKETICNLPTDPSKTANLHCSLTIVVGMIYDLTVNTNTEDGLANGASCVVKSIEYKQKETNRPSIIWVAFDELNAGNDTRLKYKNRGFYHSGIHESWTPIFDIERTFLHYNKTIQRVQFPLQPSAGRSVHRAQGSTLDSVVINLSQRKPHKVPHIHYVALSRARSLKQVQILNFNEKALTIDVQVEKEMERLHSDAKLDFCYVPFDTIDRNTSFKVAFNNCRSLHLHFSDVKSDSNLTSSHVFGFAETRLHAKDQTADYQIDGFHMMRNDQTTSSNARPANGLAVYTRDSVLIKNQILYSSKHLETIFLHISQEPGYTDLQLVFLYKAPSMSDTDFLVSFKQEVVQHLILSKPFIIIGDFNIDHSNDNNATLKKLNKLLSCKIINNEPTTDFASTIDLVLSNISGIVSSLEAFWSDHKIICVHD